MLVMPQPPWGNSVKEKIFNPVRMSVSRPNAVTENKEREREGKNRENIKSVQALINISAGFTGT